MRPYSRKYTIDKLSYYQGRKTSMLYSTVEFTIDGRKIATKGPGNWSNKSLLEFLIALRRKK